mmetsp:Transcript_83282/g.258582  ORF Transcript_83282/g.258582 Transcript_83282/m.258582 type:complete len:319 (-) Transcript_83282:86-1042(-)
MLRVLRACRVIRHFKQLHLLVQGFLTSMQAVFWIAVLFISVVFVAGIICTTIVGQRSQDWGPPEGTQEDADQIDLMFGTLLRSMITMFQMVTLDNWADICGLVGKRSYAMNLFFIAYTLMTAFAMIALLTGVITENVNSVSSAGQKEDEDKRFSDFVDTLQYAFHITDSDEDGGLSIEEFTNLVAMPEVEHGILHRPGQASWSADDIVDFFKSLDASGDGKVTWSEFRSGLKRVQGPAAARQVALLRADVHQLVLTLKAGEPSAKDGGAGSLSGGEPKAASGTDRIATAEARLQALERQVAEATQAALRSSPVMRRRS